MKKCFPSKQFRILVLGLTYLCIPASFVLFGLGIYLILQDVWLGWIIALLGIAYFTQCVFYVGYYSREYQLSETGIWVQYFKRFRIFFPWNSVSKICICEAEHNRKYQTHEVLIWCAFQEDLDGPPNPKQKWTSGNYAVLRFKTVQTMLYSEERLAEFEKNTNIDILDYRNLFS